MSHATAGVILKHDHYGSYLDAQGRTIDGDLEKESFNFAGQTLGEIWSDMMIDGQPVFAMYVEHSETYDLVVPEKSQEWFEIHVRTSQYLLQISKCDSLECCGPHRSNLRDVLPTGFLPAPVKFKHSENGKIITVDVSDKNGKFLPLFQQLACTIKPSFSGYLKVYFFI